MKTTVAFTILTMIGTFNLLADPAFAGLMTGEINHSYDGGLYAELIQNMFCRHATSR